MPFCSAIGWGEDDGRGVSVIGVVTMRRGAGSEALTDTSAAMIKQYATKEAIDEAEEEPDSENEMSSVASYSDKEEDGEDPEAAGKMDPL